jgi:hypothetical protein
MERKVSLRIQPGKHQPLFSTFNVDLLVSLVSADIN